MRRRSILLIASVLIASVGTALVAMYVRQADARAVAGEQTVHVVVATKPIDAGQTAAAASSSLEERTIPRSAAAPGAITSTSAIAGQTAVVPILAGEQVLAPMFSRSPAAAGPLPVPAGLEAVGVQASGPAAAGGYLRRGVKLEVWSAGSHAQRLLSDAEVLAVGPYGSTSTAGTPQTGLVMLGVRPEQVGQVIQAQSGEGGLWLVLPGS